MSFNTFGKIFRFTTWGESHGPAIGCVVDGCPPNIPINEDDIQKEEPISLDNISLALGGDDSNLINPIDTNRNLIATNISSLEEPSPNIVTLPMGGDVMSGSSGSSNPPSTPSNEIPPITSTDGSNPYISFSESIYGVLA